MKLPKKIKRKWLKALRSGEYKQARAALYVPAKAGFCCLGVLQHCTSGGLVEVDNDFPEYFRDTPSAKWYADNGIEMDVLRPNDDYVSDADETTLMQMNDRMGMYTTKKMGFKKIANWIEKNIGTTD